jgi:hypothetical protein
MNGTAWKPPDTPDPSAILHSAVLDKRAGKFEEALAKYRWFHHHALQYEPGLSAVRLSFAMMYWLDLAADYSPARDAFIQTRDEAECAFCNKLSDSDLFHEVASFNERLGDEARTADLFEEVAQRDHEAAQRLYHVAERSLIAIGRYRACGPFLDPIVRMSIAADNYRLSKQFEASRPASVSGIPVPQFARIHFIRDVARLVALLALNDRPVDAKNACTTALQTLNDNSFRMTLNAALTGHLPDRSNS